MSGNVGSLWRVNGDNRRRFELYVPKPQVWRVFDAIEQTGVEAAPEGFEPVVTVEHSTGSYTKRSVDDAKRIADRSGFRIRRLDLTFWDDEAAQWVTSEWRWSRGKLLVEVKRGTEVEVNGVYSMLHDAAKAANGFGKASLDVLTFESPLEAGPANGKADMPWTSAVERWNLTWKSVLNHGWTIGVGSAVVGTVAGGVLLAWLLQR